MIHHREPLKVVNSPIVIYPHATEIPPIIMKRILIKRTKNCIGGAYFRKLQENDYDKLWKNHLKGIVAEYFRGEPEADSKVKDIEDAYKKAQPNQEPA